MAKDVMEVLEKNGLKRGEDGLKVNMMAELPATSSLPTSSLSTLTASQSAATTSRS